jgi:hypothetical protein
VSRKTLLDDREYSGLVWSLPHAPDQEIVGTVAYKDGRILLTLHGSFAKTTASNIDGEFRPAIINGRRKWGTRVTLYQTRELSSPGGESHFLASWMLVGRTFKSESEIRPQELSVSYTHLRRWALDEIPFAVEWEPSADGTKSLRQ